MAPFLFRRILFVIFIFETYLNQLVCYENKWSWTFVALSASDTTVYEG